MRSDLKLFKKNTFPQENLNQTSVIWVISLKPADNTFNAQVEIDTEDYHPVCRKLYLSPQMSTEVTKKAIKNMRNGSFPRTISEWSSFVVLVTRKDGHIVSVATIVLSGQWHVCCLIIWLRFRICWPRWEKPCFSAHWMLDVTFRQSHVDGYQNEIRFQSLFRFRSL